MFEALFFCLQVTQAGTVKIPLWVRHPAPAEFK